METLEQPLFSIERVPRWVKRRDYDPAQVSMYADHPHFFLLVDYQEHYCDDEIHAYYRSVQKINDLSQVEDASLFLRELRTGNERMIYHRLDLLRDGRSIAALNPQNISAYQRERLLKKHVTNGRVTVNHSVDDLRVGDLIDIQVSLVERANDHPVVVKHNLTRYWLAWNCLVLDQNIRIVNRSKRSLNLHHHFIEEGQEYDSHVELKPKQECERHYSRLAPKSISSTAPEWLHTDFLQVTPMISWSQISRQMHRIYAAAASADNDLVCGEIGRLKLTGDQRIDALRIIRFVQDEIRYLSENEGIFSHTPRAPREVLKRSAGDCKGKSTLLMVLLKSIGVEANTALVNSDAGKAIGNFKPSPCHFNHVIVRVVIGDQHYYFDPTLQHQAGDFEHAAQLDYGYTLNLTATGEELCALPWELSRKLYEISHRFDLRGAHQGNGSVTITRKNLAQQADRTRAYLRASTAKKAQDKYFERANDDINTFLDVITPLQVVSDDLDRNLLVTRELYRIRNVEDICNGGEGCVTTNFHLGFPYPEDERFELQMTVEGVLEHRIEVLHKGEIDLEQDSLKISNRLFEYHRTIASEAAVLNVHKRVVPRREVVGHNDIAVYHEDARRVYRDRNSRFRFQTENKAADTVDIPWANIAAFILVSAIFVAIHLLL